MNDAVAVEVDAAAGRGGDRGHRRRGCGVQIGVVAEHPGREGERGVVVGGVASATATGASLTGGDGDRHGGGVGAAGAVGDGVGEGVGADEVRRSGCR